MNEAELRDTIAKYSFYHIFQLTEAIATPGWQEFLKLQEPIQETLRSLDLKGKRFLDIGCRDGLFSFEAEKLGARKVIGIDNDLSPAATEFLIPYFKSSIEMHQVNVLDLSPDMFGKFDVILFAGVLYHLRYPFWGLKCVADALEEGGTLIIETGILVDDNSRPLLFCPIGNESPYEPTSCTFFNLKGLSDSLFSLGLVVEQVRLLETPGNITLEPPEKLALKIDILNEQPNYFTPVKIKIDPIPENGIDRAVLVCHKDSSMIFQVVAKYWDSTHKMHETNSFIENPD